MIPTPEQLSAIGRMTAGNLRQVPFATLLCSIATSERTVVLELRRNQLEKKIVFDKGSPVDCRSNLAHETLGRFLMAEGKINEEQFNASLAKAASKGVPLGEILVESEIIGGFELYRVLQQNLAKKLLDCFTWRDGTFEIKLDPPEVDSSLKVKAPQLVVTGVMKFASQEDVDKSVVPLIGKQLILHPAPQFPLDEIKLPSAHTRLLESINGEFRIDDLAAGDLPYEDVTRVLYALAVIGIVVRAELVSPAMRRAQAPKPPQKPPLTMGTTAGLVPIPQDTATAPAPAPRFDIEKLRDEIMQAYLAYRRQDSFDLLRLDEKATQVEIEEAYLRLAQRFNPLALDGTPLGNIADKAREIALAVGRAFGELADPLQREAVIDRRAQKREEHRRSLAAGRFAIKTDLLDPSVQFRKGKALMDGGMHREAIQLLEFAADCDSQNVEYRAELAWCRFLDSSSNARQSIADLKEAMRIDPQNGLAAFYAGEIHRITGNKTESEPLLRKACKLMAPDRRPVEALKTLLTSK
ncbi:MAG: DUF4388 domain-containing protein [Acidobacteria bacterium]|nr:DUF4388 domain-containing protein [Acidobacteriota bacterium]